jgi:xanthine dehydrogenase accessory factor
MVDLVDDPGTRFDWPLFGLTEDVREAAAGELSRGRPVALATLVGVRGGAPRPLGARMLADADGAPAGYVSGGCVEGAVAEWGREVIASGETRRVWLGAGSPFVDIQLTCGGAIEIYIERVAPDDPLVRPWLSGLTDRADRWWLADLSSGARAVAETLDGPAPRGLESALALAQSCTRDAAREGELFVRREAPRLRLVLVGGDPVALALAQLAGAMGIEAVLIRDRGPAAPPPGLSVHYIDADPAVSLAMLQLDRWTAVVSTTHEVEEDEGALAVALSAGALYVGALGSRRRAPARKAGLRALGMSEAQVARVRSPVGLAIGAASPFEIAIAVLADIVRVRRLGPEARDLVVD